MRSCRRWNWQRLKSVAYETSKKKQKKTIKTFLNLDPVDASRPPLFFLRLPKTNSSAAAEGLFAAAADGIRVVLEDTRVGSSSVGGEFDSSSSSSLEAAASFPGTFDADPPLGNSAFASVARDDDETSSWRAAGAGRGGDSSRPPPRRLRPPQAQAQDE